VSLPFGVPTVVADLAVADVRAELGEGPIWDARSSKLLWVDILHAKVHSTDPATGVTTTLDLSEHTRHVTTVVPCEGSEGSDVVVGTTEGIAMVNLDSGAVVQHPSNGAWLAINSL
jgi:sugar lactone lactonase YvrE